MLAENPRLNEGSRPMALTGMVKAVGDEPNADAGAELAFSAPVALLHTPNPRSTQ